MRRFLQGFGLGILLAALVMGISYRGSGSSAGEDIVEKARELGMVFPSGTAEPDDFTDTGSDTGTDEYESGSGTSVSGEAVKGAGLGADKTDDTDTPTQKPDNNDNTTAKPKNTAAPKATSAPTLPSNISVGDKVTFTVESGLLSSSVAREMKKAGIIADDTAFDHYLVEQGLGKQVIAGTYELTVGASYEELARIITHTG